MQVGSKTELEPPLPEKRPLFTDEDSDVELDLQKEVNASEQLDLQSIIQLKEAFDIADADGSGKLDMDEFVEAFGSVLAKNMSSKKLQQLFMKIDANSDGGVEWDEFMNYILLENQSLALMKEQDFNYVKNDEEDPTNGAAECHEDMITKVMIIKTKGLIKNEGKAKISSKFVTAGKDGNLKFYNMKGKHESTIEASVSYILSIAFLPECNTLVASTETKELLFFEVNPLATQTSVPIGKYAPFPQTLIDIEGFYVKSLNRHFLIGGDDTGCLNFIELKYDWHVCNDDLLCHQQIHKEFYWDRMNNKRKDIIREVKKQNQDFEEGKSEKKRWLWKELENKSFFRVHNHHHIHNIQISQLQLHTKSINKVHYIPDLKVVVTCSSDGTLTVVNFDILLELKKEKNQPVSIANLIRLASADPSIDNEKKIRTFTEHKKIVKTCLWSQKFRLMASAGDERHIIVWDIFTCSKISYLHGHTSSIQDLALNEERNHLISLGVDKLVIIWDIRSCTLLKMIPDKTVYQPEDLLTCMIFDPFSEQIVLTSRKMNFWPFRTKFEASGTSHDDEVVHCIFNLAFDYVISIDGLNNVTSWDIKDGNMLFKFVPEGKAKITYASFDKSERRIILGDSEGQIRIYNFNNGQLLQTVETEKGVEITSILHADTLERGELAHIIAGGWEKKAYIWREDPEEVKLEKTIPKNSLYEYHKADITCMAYSEQYNSIFSGDTEGILMIWDNKNSLLHKFTNCLSTVLNLNEADKSIIKIIILDEKGIFFTLSSGQMIRVWSLQTHQILLEKSAYHYEAELLTTAAVYENNFVTADSGGYLKIWDIGEVSGLVPKRENFKELAFIRAHLKEISCVDFVIVPDQHIFIVTGSIDKNLKLYTLEGGLIGIFGKMFWKVSDPSTLKRFKPRYAVPELRKEASKKVPNISPNKLSVFEIRKLKMKKTGTSLDKEASSVSFDKADTKSSVRKNTGRLSSSRVSVSRTAGKGGQPSKSTIDEDIFEGDIPEKHNLSFNLNSGPVILEPIKLERKASPLPKKPLGFIEKSPWKEKVENSLLEAREFLRNESWDISNPQVDSILKRYATPQKLMPVSSTKKQFGYPACAAKFLDSEKHVPLPGPIRLKQIVKFMAEEKNPSNKFNVEFFQKGFIFQDFRAKERSRSTNAKFEMKKR